MLLRKILLISIGVGLPASRNPSALVGIFKPGVIEIAFEKKSERMPVMNQTTRITDFTSKITPYLGVLTQISLGLTQNGRDATKLMREVIAEACLTWDESKPEESYDLQMYEIMTRRRLNGLQQHAHSSGPIFNVNPDGTVVISDRTFDATSTDTSQKSSQFENTDEYVRYERAIRRLPSVFQSAMILSYIEGRSNTEIAVSAGVRPHKIASLLRQGLGLIRKEYFAYVICISVSTNLLT